MVIPLGTITTNSIELHVSQDNPLLRDYTIKTGEKYDYINEKVRNDVICGIQGTLNQGVSPEQMLRVCCHLCPFFENECRGFQKNQADSAVVSATVDGLVYEPSFLNGAFCSPFRSVIDKNGNDIYWICNDIDVQVHDNKENGIS